MKFTVVRTFKCIYLPPDNEYMYSKAVEEKRVIKMNYITHTDVSIDGNTIILIMNRNKTL
jgi:hypothetical protein